MNLRIGPHKVSVAVMTPGASSEEGSFGLYRPASLRIEVSADMAPSRQAEILLHEVLHAVWDAACLGAKAEEEEAVGALAKGILQVLTDNPELVPMLRSAQEGTPIFSN